jgi:drug/metabolite transporter (DMT)-like permease
MEPTSSGILAPRPLLGYLAMLGNTVLIPIMAVAIKYLTAAEFTTIQMLGWRSWLVLLVLLPFLFIGKIRKALLAADLKAHMIHATFSVSAMACFYYALRSLPIVTVTSINFTTPAIAMLLASLLYREQVSRLGWLALLLGFVGALIILKPDIGGISFDMVVVLVGSFLAACTNLAVRRMPARSSNFAVIFYLTFSGVIFFGLPSLFDFRLPAGDQWIWIIVLGAVALGVHSFIILAYRFASSMLVGALDYLRIVWALGFGYFLFSETLGLSDIIGIVMICASGLMSVSSGSRKAQIKSPGL